MGVCVVDALLGSLRLLWLRREVVWERRGDLIVQSGVLAAVAALSASGPTRVAVGQVSAAAAAVWLVRRLGVRPGCRGDRLGALAVTVALGAVAAMVGDPSMGQLAGVAVTLAGAAATNFTPHPDDRRQPLGADLPPGLCGQPEGPTAELHPIVWRGETTR